MNSFAESPSCASYARDVIEWQKPPYNHRGPGPYYPPGVQNGFAHKPYLCCGGCKFGIPAVQILHWSTTTAECLLSNATITSYVESIPRSSQISWPADTSQSSAGKFAIVDGSTLEFSSLYLAIHGAVSVYDSCGIKGRIHYNPTIAMPPGDLSTLSWPNNLIGFGGSPPHTGAYDPAACRTYGVDNGSTYSWSNGLSSWMTSVSYNMGPPYNPILLPPEQLTALDPQWEACTAWDNYGADAYDLFYGLYDPPRALTAAPALVEPITTAPGPTARHTSPAPQPAASLLPTDPRITARPHIDPSPSHGQAGSPDQDNPDAGLASFILAPFQKGSNKGIDEPAVPTESIASPDRNPIASPGPGAGVKNPDSNHGNLMPDPDSRTTQSSQDPPNPLGTSPPVLTIDGIVYTANRDSQYIINSMTLSPGGPTFHMNDFAYSLPPSTTLPPSIVSIFSAISSLENGPILTINGKKYTADSASHYVVGSQTLTPGGLAITVDTVVYALPSSLTAIISGSSTIPLDPQRTPEPAILSMLELAGVLGTPQIYIVDGITLTGDPNALRVGSTSLTPGSPPLTVSGHTLSLTSAGLIVVDGHTSDLASQLPSVSPKNHHTYNVDGITLIGDPTSLVVGSTTLTPDSPPLTLSGHLLALQSGGALIVDDQTLELESSPPTTDGQTFTISGLVLTQHVNDVVAVGSTTLSPGSTPLTISGHVLSMATKDGVTVVVVDGYTSTLMPLASSSGEAGAMSGLGNDDKNIDVFAGAASRHKDAKGVVQTVVLLLVTCVSSCLVF